LKRVSRFIQSIAVVALFALAGGPARAAGIADLQAAAHALGFLDGLPHDGVVIVAIVYMPQAPDSRAVAIQTAAWLNSLPGPNKTSFRARPVTVDELAQGNDHLDAIYLPPGLSAAAATIVNAMRRRHLVSISNDPTCLDDNCCVLMVRAEGGIEIVLHTAVADAVGANFSNIFTMMVKHR